MSIGFDWQIDIEDDEDEPIIRPPRYPWLKWVLLVVVVLFAAAMGGAGYLRVDRAQDELREMVQHTIQQQQAAFSAGDGDLFFTYFDENPDLRFAQLNPTLQKFHQTPIEVTTVQPNDQEIWANLIWEENGEQYQRVAFFERRGDTTVQIANPTDYWGGFRTVETSWGILTLNHIDLEFADQFEAIVADSLAQNCPKCVPFTLNITDNFDAAVYPPDTFNYPSPVLVGLNKIGQPADFYWDELRTAIDAQFAPITLRFAIPPSIHVFRRSTQYQPLARAFEEQFPNIKIEIVNSEELPDDPSEMLPMVDGAVLTPDEQLLASGLVYDLTSFVNQDPFFLQNDFYEQIWRGAVWRDRVWMVPYAAQMNLMFFDRGNWAEAMNSALEISPTFSDPQYSWTFDEMAAQIDRLAAVSGKDGLMLANRDLFFSHAYAHSNTLSSQTVEDTLNWYASLNNVLDLSYASDEDERIRLALSKLSSRRQASLWTETPGKYEYHLLLKAIGVAPFPSSERLESVAPLWVGGSVISANTQHPGAVWKWISFLSHTTIESSLRLIPARVTVAYQSDYWNTIPTELNSVMRNAFPTARAVQIEHQTLFSWEQIDLLVNGGVSAETLSQRPELIWFNHK